MLFQRNPNADKDVAKLLAAFTDLKADGRLITHEELETLLGVKRTASYYHCVLRSWRRAVFTEQALYLDGISADGQGLKVLTPDESVRFSNRLLRSAGRRAHKGLTIAASVREEDIVDQKTRLYRAQVLATAALIVSTHDKSLKAIGAILKPTAALPRVTTA